MKGDIRTYSRAFSIFSYASANLPESNEDEVVQHETIKPYTRKWETSVMNTIDQLHLISKTKPSSLDSDHKCEVWHDIPAIFFSTGGYTGNVYHEFNDGIIPLYITSQHYNKKVIFVVLEYHDWWYTKYAPILSQLSDFPPINFNSDPRTHCFREAVVGLKIHNELAIESSLTKGNKTILDFRNLLGQAFDPFVPLSSSMSLKRPKLLILSRKGSRSITNEHSLIKLAHRVGFDVQVLKPDRNTELASIYSALSTSDVMVGVHGAAMTHLLFLRPGSVLIQVIPLGTDWASETYYGEPAKKLGLKYIGYKINPMESSLYHKYKKNDPVLTDPESVNKKGWEFTKRIYLGDQNVTLDLKRFKKLLVQAYEDYRLRNSKSRAALSC